MNSKTSSIRAPGQRAITSTLLFRASNQSGDCKKNVEIKAPTKNGSHLSLSDFLNRKLHRSSVLPTSIPGKEVAFSSPLCGEASYGAAVGGTGKSRGGKAEPNVSLDGVIQILKNVGKSDNDNTNSHVCDGIESFHMGDLEQTRKRKNLFEDNKPSARKVLAVLGEDSKPSQSRKRNNFTSNEESKSVFNHYADGGGWWDENMAGVDNEEVGCNDAWEGLGCTTLGGIEWN